ncbi:hypothetical protein [Streptomyces antibioticus]|uniref:hypothetical protein n=1 Tax=Streptomyces antibioticus TaxID=1890 RepID=UPI003D72C150
MTTRTTTAAAACEPGRFCPEHPLDPGLLVLIAVALVAITLFATAAVALVATVDQATRYVVRRIRRTRRPAPPEPRPPHHLTVIAAALDDWWLVTDPRAPFDGAAIAPRVENYLLSSGYQITPCP